MAREDTEDPEVEVSREAVESPVAKNVDRLVAVHVWPRRGLHLRQRCRDVSQVMRKSVPVRSRPKVIYQRPPKRLQPLAPRENLMAGELVQILHHTVGRPQKLEGNLSKETLLCKRFLIEEQRGALRTIEMLSYLHPTTARTLQKNSSVHFILD